MSAPNADKPGEGIVGQIGMSCPPLHLPIQPRRGTFANTSSTSLGNSVQNAANYVAETVQGKGAEASKEANKEQAKGNTPNSSLSDRVSGATGAISDKLDQSKHEGSASANKHSI
jgi:hypothetical protein